MAQADLDRAKKSMSGDTPKLSTQTKTGDRIKLITDNAGKRLVISSIQIQAKRCETFSGM
ncbi:hypothetical protein LNO78_28450 [Klebsiella pneumoniae subsp. pneumoniae]|nr:hypothetical protein [Klebsiella pneumoniae subsp. pneumoniae]